MNILIKFTKRFLAVIAVLLLLLLFFLTIGFRVDLSPWRDTILGVANNALPYHLALEGDIEARVSLRPSVKITNARLAPRSNPEASMVDVGLISAKIGVLPLLRNTVDIDHILAENVAVRLERSEQGKANWEIDSTEPDKNSSANDSPASSSGSSGLPSGFELKIDQQVAVKNLSFVYDDQQDDIQFDGRMDDLVLSADDADNLVFHAEGEMQGVGWAVNAKTALSQHLKGQAGNIELQAMLDDARLSIQGEFNLAKKQDSQFQLEIRAPTAPVLETFAGSEVARMAPISVDSRVTMNPAALLLNDINIELAESDLSGQLEVRRGKPPRLSGSLSMNQLNFTPWLEQADTTEDDPEVQEPNTATASQDSEPEEEVLPLNQLVNNWLNSAVVNLDVEIGETIGLPVSVSDTHITVEMADGQLKAPVSVVIEGINLSGHWETTASERRIRTEAALSAQQANIGPLMAWLMEAPAKGEVDAFSLNVHSRGRSVARLIRNARLELAMENGRLLVNDNEDWRVRTANASMGLTKNTEVSVDADLLSIPVDITMQADPLIAIRRGKDWHLDLQVNSPAFTASAKGFVAESGFGENSQFAIEMNATHLGDLSRWLGVKPDVKEPMRFRGSLHNQRASLGIALSQLVIGESTGKLDIDWIRKEEGGLAKIVARLPRLNVDQLVTLFPEGKEFPEGEAPSTGQATGQKSNDTPSEDGFKLDVPLLADEIYIADADIDFRMDSLFVAGQTLSDLKFSGYIRDGRLKPSPLSAIYAGSYFYGDLALDLRHQTIASDFNLNVDRPDFGRMMSELGVIDDVDVTLDKARFNLKLRGETIAELIRTVELQAALDGGLLRLNNGNGEVSDVLLNAGTITARPNLRTTLKMDGELKNLPVTFEVSFNPLNRLLTNPKNVNMQLSAHINDMTFMSYAMVNLPIERRTARLGLIFKTPSLTRLNPLLDVDMPPYGPVGVNGRLGMKPTGFEIAQSKITVGDSELTGKIELKTESKPELDIQLTASSIQLNDFRTGDWKAWSSEDNEEETVAETPAENDEEEPSLLSAEILHRLNMNFRLDVDEVLSGDDHLGEGQLYLKLQEGDLSLNPLYIALPGGEINAHGHLRAQEDGFAIGLKADIDRLDYGVLARRIDPYTKMQGDISFRMDIETVAQTPEDLFSHAKGDFGFAVWPRDFEAGIIDLWAVGLATAVLPRLGPSDPSQLNCAVGTFQLEDGQMKDNVLMLDTSKMQVLGHSDIDFTHEKINLVLVPRAKTAQIFGLSLPVMVSGSFNDFGFGIPSGELIVTTIRFLTSPVVAPLRWLLEQPLEENGSHLCTQMYNESVKPPLK
ncbi:AsmA family protein [Endozoicomonas montiporae]|uniref:AsmA family protein n=1 Tax=Endozoicomonas montiporae TaxID=1027273 RepID=UPI0013645E80|nr:AsmA family protein [Endozoicomonas montiporae]